MDSGIENDQEGGKILDPNKLTENGAHLSQYIKYHVGDREPFECVCCKRRLRYKSDTIRHVRTHTGDKPFACSLCEKKFSCTNNMYKHMRAKHSGKLSGPRSNISSNQDEINEQSSNGSSEDDIEHVKNTSRQKPIGCSTCEKTFCNRKDSNRHGMVHIGEKPHACSFCSKSYKHSVSLHNHIKKQHRGSNSYKKKNARSVVTRRIGLHIEGSRLEDTASGKKNELSGMVDNGSKGEQVLKSFYYMKRGSFECGVCNKQFRYKSDVDRHVRVHTGEKPFKCSFCVKTFTNSSNLYKHVKRRHALEAANGGGKNVHRNSTLDESDYKPDDNLNSQVCLNPSIVNAVDLPNSQVNVHVRIKRNIRLENEKKYKCSECTRSFNFLSNFYKHMRRIHKECTIRKMRDSNHIGGKEKRYKCCECSHTCNFLSNLYKHMRKIHEGCTIQKWKESVKNAEISSNRNKIIRADLTPLTQSGKRYKCSECYYCSNFIGNVYKHMRRKHKGCKIQTRKDISQCSKIKTAEIDSGIETVGNNGGEFLLEIVPKFHTKQVDKILINNKTVSILISPPKRTTENKKESLYVSLSNSNTSDLGHDKNEKALKICEEASDNSLCYNSQNLDFSENIDNPHNST